MAVSVFTSAERMKRIVIMSVLVAVLLCPLVSVSGSCDTDADEDLYTTKLVFDETKTEVYDGKDTKLHSGDTIELGDAIRISPLNDNVRVLINGEITDKVGVKFGIPGKYFQTDELLIEIFNYYSISFEYVNNENGLKTPDTIKNVSIFDQITLPDVDCEDVLLKEWFVTIDDKKYSFYPGDMSIDRDFTSLFSDSTNIVFFGLLEYAKTSVTLKTNGGIIDNELWSVDSNGDYISNFNKSSGDINLPSVEYDWHDFIEWVDENGVPYETIKAGLHKNLILYANQKLKEFKINFYLTQDSNEIFESMILTKENCQTPIVSSEDYDQKWYYTDQNGDEYEFKDGAPLQNDMKVYTKYKVYDVYFYETSNSSPIVKGLSKGHFEVPLISADNFLGWFYKDQSSNECEFKEGVPLSDNMVVYAKYDETSTDDSGSKDINLYTLLTENGISITDNEVVETVAASVIFVMLALMTFIFVFRRQ